MTVLLLKRRTYERTLCILPSFMTDAVRGDFGFLLDKPPACSSLNSTLRWPLWGDSAAAGAGQCLLAGAVGQGLSSDSGA